MYVSPEIKALKLPHNMVCKISVYSEIKIFKSSIIICGRRYTLPLKPVL